jgi:hypothetical protein
VNDGGTESGLTIIDVANLSGSGGFDNEEVLITRVVASVASDATLTPAFVTLSWGDGTEFLHLGPGETDLDISFRTPNDAGNHNADVTVTAARHVFYTLRIFAKKMIGFPLSMGHGPNRP